MVAFCWGGGKWLKKIGVVLVGNSWIMRNFVGSNDDAH